MNKKDYDEFMKHCQVIQKINDDKILLRVKQTQELIVLKYIRNATIDLIPVLSQQKQISHEYLQSIIDYYQVSADTIAVLTQYSTHSLQQQIIARRKSNSRFSYEEIENILVSVLKALNYLESKLIGHGCVSMKDIVISSNGVVKLIDPCLATSSPLTLMAGYYYSPQLLYFNNLKAQSKTNNFSQTQAENIDFFKNDMFVLALLIIQLGLLHCNLQDCVRYDTGNIDYELLQNYFNQFECLFGNQPFIHLLFQMLQQDPNQRISSQQALKFIQQVFQSQDDQDQQFEDSSVSSNVWQSKDKTVRSFLLSQGPINSVQSSLKQSQLMQNSVKTNRFSINNKINNKMGRTPLIKC